MCDAFGRIPLNKNLSFVYCITFLRFVKGIFLCEKCRIFGCEKSFLGYGVCKFVVSSAKRNLLHSPKKLLSFRSCAPMRKGRMQRCAGVGGLATSRRANFQAKLSLKIFPRLTLFAPIEYNWKEFLFMNYEAIFCSFYSVLAFRFVSARIA